LQTKDVSPENGVGEKETEVEWICNQRERSKIIKSKVEMKMNGKRRQGRSRASRKGHMKRTFAIHI
jgi:hypothetical protein